MIVAGTGHRPSKVGGYGHEAAAKRFKVARYWLLNNKPDKVISGMALGWDQDLAHAAIHLDIPLIAAVPFIGQQNFWPQQSVLWYNDLLNKAEEVVFTAEAGYAPWKMQVRNQWMVDHCDTVLALWDGSAGGTGNCIKYAQKVGKPIINLWENYESLA